MSQPLSVLPIGVQSSEGLRATVKVTANSRVTTPTGPVGVMSDIMQFPGPGSVAGNWLVGATRVSVMGIPVINQVSTGLSYGAVPPAFPPTGPMTVVQGDTRVMGL